MHLVVGLGNPGRRYARTRHNAGFIVVDRLAARWNIGLHRKTAGAQCGDGPVAGVAVTLAQPQSFMNLSGQPVRALVDFYKVAVDEVLVVHDDVDLPFGVVRLKSGGGHGGHNGLRDLSQHLGPGYGRVRVGVGRPPEGWDTADYVLGTWTSAEEAALPDVLDSACDALETALRVGLPAAMNQFNTRPKDPKDPGSVAGSPSAPKAHSSGPVGS